MQQVQRQKIMFVDYLIVIARRKKLIAGVTLVFVLTTAVAVFLMPVSYRAYARILTPDLDHATSLQLMNQWGGVPLPGGLLAKKSTTDLYIGLLQSRTVLDRMVDRFGLEAVYGTTYREEARNRLLGLVHIENDRKSGIVGIGVEDRDPKRAAQLANCFVEELKDLTREMAGTEASQRRLFYEEKLKEARNSLVRSEEAMRGFQEKTGAIEIKEQARAIIESVANLRAQVAAKEVHVKVLKTYATPQNPDLQRMEEELQGLKEQLVKMETKTGTHSNPITSTFSVAEAGTGYARKMRDLKNSETLFELLIKQYEMARISESRNTTLIQVVDPAIPPEKREKPKRARAIVLALVAGLFTGTVASFLLQIREQNLNDPVYRERVETLKLHLLMKSKRTGSAGNNERHL